MKSTSLVLFCALLSLCPVNSFAQEQNSWGDAFDCAVDWFSGCVPEKTIREKAADKPKEIPAGRANISSLLQGPNNSNLPAPVKNVLENPSSETARAYVAWSRQGNEKLAKASEYIAQAMREINSEASIFRNRDESSNDLALAGVGPVGLYYFFSPGDQSAVEDVRVLNKIWREGRIGVVGIRVRGNDEEVVKFVNEARPLFPIRRSDAEVKLVRPTETPDLYLALPLEKKILRLGPTITETAITDAIGNILAAQTRGMSTLDSVTLVDR
jgi:hypothetical protein